MLSELEFCASISWDMLLNLVLTPSILFTSITRLCLRHYWHFTCISRAHLEACTSCLFLRWCWICLLSRCRQWGNISIKLAKDKQVITPDGMIPITISHILGFCSLPELKCILSCRGGVDVSCFANTAKCLFLVIYHFIYQKIFYLHLVVAE